MRREFINMKLKVYISAGHGGSDPGAVGNGLQEKAVNLKIATYLKDELAKRGCDIKMTRTSDVFKDLNTRTREANSWGADVVVDVHCNAATASDANGFEIFHSVVGGKSKTLATGIEKYISKRYHSRGVKTRVGDGGADYFAMIRETNAPAVLAEAAFVSNAKDAAMLKSENNLKIIAQDYARGVCETFGVPWVITPPPPPPKPDKIYRVQVGAYSNKANAEAMRAKLKKAGFDALIIES